MRTKRIGTMIGAAVCAATLMAACENDEPAADERTTTTGVTSVSTDSSVSTPATSTTVAAADSLAKVEYRFNDSSVPPEYHRSYSLTVTADEARIVVDSYGDVLHDVTVDVDEDTWQRTLEAAGELVGEENVESDEVCSGGTSEELLLTDAAGAEVTSLFVDHCGTSAAPDIERAVAAVLPLFDLETLLATE